MAVASILLDFVDRLELVSISRPKRVGGRRVPIAGANSSIGRLADVRLLRALRRRRRGVARRLLAGRRFRGPGKQGGLQRPSPQVFWAFCPADEMLSQETSESPKSTVLAA